MGGRMSRKGGTKREGRVFECVWRSVIFAPLASTLDPSDKTSLLAASPSL